jgi:hypothetical protein
MNYDDLIALSIEEAEKILKHRGIKYNINYVDTFKLSSPDRQAVVKVSESCGMLTLYVCGFTCKANKYEKN